MEKIFAIPGVGSVALLAEGVDRNDSQALGVELLDWSPSSRRAWIEISLCLLIVESVPVALLAEGVDRNWILCSSIQKQKRRPPRGGRG